MIKNFTRRMLSRLSVLIRTFASLHLNLLAVSQINSCPSVIIVRGVHLNRITGSEQLPGHKEVRPASISVIAYAPQSPPERGY